MKNLIFHCMAVLCAFAAVAQPNDSVRSLEEVIVIGHKKNLNLKQSKPLATLDGFLDNAGLAMIRRGSYAWEPVINGMATERTLVTIEGMHIFGACTDKMDPVTSYVEVSNLSEAHITSGQQGGIYGATIGGALDLKRNRSGFAELGWKGTLSTGYETNGGQKILGTALNYSAKRFFADTDFMLRDSKNYRAGGNEPVPFS